MNDTPEIQVYCRLREDELSQDAGGGLTCTRCMKTLVNLGDPAAVAAARAGGGLGCGFFRKMAVPALASSMMLSSCATPAKIMAGTPVMNHVPGEKESTENGPGSGVSGGDIVGPGTYTPLKGWPVAERVPGKPGMVYSPYNGDTVDVSDLKPGKLVLDPRFHMKDKKFFRVPELKE
jgi:hypothetical protein